MSVNIISASETGCFMSYLCSCSGGAARVECSSSGGDDTAVKSGVVCAAGSLPAQPSSPHTNSSRVSVQTEAADWTGPGPHWHEYDATGAM